MPLYHAKPPVEPQHVERKALYTDLQARVHYLQKFLEFSADDVAALNQGSKYIKALAPVLIDRVYVKLLENDITARVFRTRSTASEDEVADYPTFDSPYIQRRRMFLRWYMTKLCTDPTKPEFYEYLNTVGRMHTGKDRMLAFNVEYIHIGACLGFIQDIIIDGIFSHPQLTLTFKIALVRALSKVIWIQNDLFARWRVRDGEEFEDNDAEAFHNKDKHTEKEHHHDDAASYMTRSNTQCSEAPSMFSETRSVDTFATQGTAATMHAPCSSHSSHSACPFSGGSLQPFETKVWSGLAPEGGH
ncbi:Protoglobin-domain-containing protein [Aspergillus pseudotamarii]|uniref:Protoglobin-domain-containing protein n=1 Tax=Aspergillus pseudotamarii TaxID=132259 RepID=A0A5N6SP90_ASPPS|nr:Protoglobin-domain-containing protein [Aspergillus pseudotamarii]KAE8136506.1 Protoglobin-domain-containing protein [Aspergillus pseudotamarii]